MATITTQASAAVFRPQFLTGSSGKLNKGVPFKPIPSSSTSSFKVEAKQGEWLPGLPPPAYLNGRYITQLNTIIVICFSRRHM